MKAINNISDVVKWRLCLGCGACSYICPENAVRMLDFAEEGIRPVVREEACSSCGVCLRVCPAMQTDFRVNGSQNESKPAEISAKKWGPIVAMWEGHAADPDMRFKGSSGGVLTALGAYCLEIVGMAGVLQIGQDPDNPIRNRTRLSRTRKDLMAATGSRYSPASVCDGLGLVEEAQAPCAIVGRPAEIAAVENARKTRAELDKKVGVTFSFFCAESPATQGTVSLLEKLGVNASTLTDLRYRGLGWPGHFAPTCRGDSEPARKLSYKESWSFLQAYRPWSVQLWPDGTGELADISCGDPWYNKSDIRNPGMSLVVARTERGRTIVEEAMAAGYLELWPAAIWQLEQSQPGLLSKKGSVWGRLAVVRLLGLPIPRFSGIDLLACWRRLPLREKLRSTLGTARRIFTRKLFQPLLLNPENGEEVKSPFRHETIDRGNREKRTDLVQK